MGWPPGRLASAPLPVPYIVDGRVCSEVLHVAKGYWISFYHEVKDPDKVAAYAKLAGPAIRAGGGQFLARSTAERVYEAGVKQRTTIIEFESVERAIATHESADYKAALAALDGGAVRDIRIVSGV